MRLQGPLASFVAVTALLNPVTLRGQVGFSVQPRLSSIVPIANVYEVDRTLGVVDDPWRREVSASTIARSPAFSIAIQLGDRDAGWVLRSGVTRSVRSATLVHGVLDPLPEGLVIGCIGACELDPLDLGEAFQFELPTTLTIGFAEAVFPLLLGTEGVRPYLSVGVAVKRYSFGSFDLGACGSAGASCGAMDFSVPRSGTVVGAQVGAGILFTEFGYPLEFGVTDTFNRYVGRGLKHDLSIFLGVTMAVLR